ncbi:hypothetical protein GOBAR_DD05786 [Gossypium barbadense]|nr:hypothetical protein GOBAR_DD05786 [Gossypium barbadense]
MELVVIADGRLGFIVKEALTLFLLLEIVLLLKKLLLCTLHLLLHLNDLMLRARWLLVTSLIQGSSGGNCLMGWSDKVGREGILQIQHPRSQLNRFDLVITPRHDFYPLTPQAQEQVPQFLHRWITPREPPDRHVILTLGALHQIDSATLRSTAAAWHDEFAPLPKPLLVVNIGWPTSHCRYGADLAKQLTAYFIFGRV